MSKAPRLIPLLAVAAAGVLAVDLLENGPGVLGAARGFAEEIARAPKDKPHAAPPTPAAASPAAPAVVAAKPAPVCAPSATELAREAGLSPAELQVLQSLGARRDQLDQRAQGLDTQVSLIAAAEAKVDARITAMNALKAEMQSLLGQVDDKRAAEVDRMVKVFEVMKPADAAARFTLLSDEVRLPIAAKMKERALSAMLAKMTPPEAKRLTEALAARLAANAVAARQAISGAAASPPAAPPAAPTAAPGAAPGAGPPTQTAQAGAPGAAAASPPAKPSKPRRKPAVHHAAATPPAQTPAPAAGAAPPRQRSAQADPHATPPAATAGPAGPASGAASPAPARPG